MVQNSYSLFAYVCLFIYVSLQGNTGEPDNDINDPQLGTTSDCDIEPDSEDTQPDTADTARHGRNITGHRKHAAGHGRNTTGHRRHTWKTPTRTAKTLKIHSRTWKTPTRTLKTLKIHSWMLSCCNWTSNPVMMTNSLAGFNTVPPYPWFVSFVVGSNIFSCNMIENYGVCVLLHVAIKMIVLLPDKH